jgi:hypothetical protein
MFITITTYAVVVTDVLILFAGCIIVTIFLTRIGQALIHSYTCWTLITGVAITMIFIPIFIPPGGIVVDTLTSLGPIYIGVRIGTVALVFTLVNFTTRRTILAFAMLETGAAVARKAA